MSIDAGYEFLAPPKIVFGWGRWLQVGPLAAALGHRAFLLSGLRTLAAAGIVKQLRDVLSEHGVELVELATAGREPDVEDVDLAVERIAQHAERDGDLVIALGGGSAIDLAKAVAARATNTKGSSVKDYLEGVGSGLMLERPPLPIIAIPTTAGTGSEATKNAVISSRDPPFKKSLRSELLIPRVAIIDPQLTVSNSRDVTAHSGMDAVTQLIESYISRRARPIPQALVRQAIGPALDAIVEAVDDGSSRRAREAMSHAALISGMALANSGLGLAHGVAAALGIHFGVPHGLACAVMLPVALAVNRDSCEQPLAELATAAGIEPSAPPARRADALVERVQSICRRVGVDRRLSKLGVQRQDLPRLAHDSRGNSMDGNPRQLSDDELEMVLAERL